jgi:hypothetical protein
MITAILTSILISTTPVDSIPSAIQVKPVEFNRLTKDTVTQINWWVFGLGRDTAQGCNTYVVAYDRKGRKVTDGNVPIPAEIVKQWGTDNTLIDDFILNFYKLIKR